MRRKKKTWENLQPSPGHDLEPLLRRDLRRFRTEFSKKCSLPNLKTFSRRVGQSQLAVHPDWARRSPRREVPPDQVRGGPGHRSNCCTGFVRIFLLSFSASFASKFLPPRGYPLKLLELTIMTWYFIPVNIEKQKYLYFFLLGWGVRSYPKLTYISSGCPA